MGQGEKRLNINNLVPGERYAIQVRAVDEGQGSTWSQKYSVLTIDDTAGGTRTPNPPALSTWDIDGAGHYNATWSTNFTNTDGSVMVVKRYELELSATEGTHIIPHYVASGANQVRSFTLNTIRAYFDGALPTVLQARLRIINSADTASDWSAPLTATLPVPNPPQNVIGIPIVDGIKLTWDAPADPIHLYGYRVYFGATAGFIPDSLNRSNLVYEGPASEFTYGTLSYGLDHYFKVVSYSSAGLESTTVEPVPNPLRPVSPYGPDDVAPLKPSLTFGTTPLDRSVLEAPKANLVWSIIEGDPLNSDISGFVVRWRIVGDTTWRNAYFDKTSRAGTIDLPRPFSNYEFQISAYDFVANYSEYAVNSSTTGPLLLTGASAPPPAVTGVDSVPRWDGMRVIWNESTDSVKFGGYYEIQYNTTGTFANNTPNYTTANLFIDIAGLTSLSTYHYRVRAIDSAAQAGPWSAVDSVVLPSFPSAAATDGVAPSTAPQLPKAVPGLNYVNVSWQRVANDDPVYYEVFGSTNAAFTTLDSTTFVGESRGTSLLVSSLPGGNLIQDVTYYFKVRVMDADCKNGVTGPVSATTTGVVLTQVLATELGINMGGENLLYNSSFDTDSSGPVGGQAVADYWEVVNGNPTGEAHTATLPTGRDGVGKAQKVQWTGVASAQKGIRSVESSVLRPNTEYIVSFYALATAGNFTVTSTPALVSSLADNDNPATPSTSVYKRYIFKILTGASVDPNNVTISNTGNTTSGGSFTIDDAQIEAGNLASAYKVGTVSIAKLATGKFSTADMLISTGGRILSQAYINNSNTGFLITDAGIIIRDGSVDAKTLIANTTITSNLYVGALLEVSAAGAIRSANYSTVGNGAGFRIDSVGIDIRSGTVAAGTFSAGTITSPDIRIGTNGKITVDSTGSIQSNNYVNGTTGWKISNLGIEMWDVNSKINVNALESSTLTTTTLTLGSGGVMQSNTWAGGTGARWQLSENAFTMYNGTITGSTITTDQIYSNGSEVSGGVSRRKFSINALGYAEFTGVYIYGNAVVGNDANSLMQSGNYNGSTGWRIQGNGTANFFNMNTWNLRVYGDAIVGGGGSDYIKSANYDGGNGWAIRGAGYADFWGGLFAVGGYSGGQIRMVNWESGSSIIQFLLPGNWASYHQIRANGQNFDIRGAYGGAIIFTADTTVRSSLHHAVDYDIYAGRNLNAGNSLGAPIYTGNPQMNWLSTGVGQTSAVIGNEGRLARGSSSKRFKNSIEPLEISVARVLALEPRTFKWNDTKAFGDARYPGFIAEEAQEAGLEVFVTYDVVDEEFVPGGFRYAEFTAAQQVVLREHHKEIAELKSQVERLMNLLESTS